MGLKELLAVVPEYRLDEMSEGVGFLLIEGRFCRFSSHLAHRSQSFRIAEHIAVDSGTRILLLASAADTLLHSVLHIALPVEA